MRICPQPIVDAWYSGVFIGDTRNFARVTVQQGGTKLYQLPYNLYASSIFGSDAVPQELPNIRSVKWGRSVDQDFATATFEFFNTEPLPLGQLPDRDLDQPGYYTYNRGRSSFAPRWNQKANQWSDMLMPDNILRSYEGYGFDATVIPELDPHLVSTGVWRIDKVDYTTTGMITVTCRDIGSILVDQMIFPPVVPKNFWPVAFAKDTKKVGFIGPSANTKTQDTSDVSQPASWTGPHDGPNATTITDGDGQVTVNWTRPSTNDTTGDNTHKGYKVVGYQVGIDGVLLSTIYKATARSATIKAGINSGNVYSVGVIAIWQEVLSAKAAQHFKTTVEQKARSDYGPVRTSRPHAATTTVVTPGSIAINLDDAGTLHPGGVKWHAVGAGTYTVIAYKSNGSDRKVYKKDVAATGNTFVDTGTDLGDMTRWNFLVHGQDGSGNVGEGDVYFAVTNGAFYGAPAAGASPASTSVNGATVSKGGTTTPLKPVDVKLKFADSSNTYYVGGGATVKVYGHDGADAFDSDGSSYWLSIGNDRNDTGYAYEWLEASCANVTLTSVTVKTVKDHYGIYVSVFSDGKWVQHPNTGVIPYNPNLPESHNGGNIPYAEFTAQGSGEEQTITLRDAIPHVTKIRVTLHNLQYFGDTSPLHYRGAIRTMTAKGQTGGDVKVTTGNTKGSSSSSETSETIYTPAHINPGLGARPLLYKDYTDIVKLLCAWGGFYWASDSQTVLSDGSTVQFDWGLGPYGLPNVDPVLGDVDGGRVWGDFENTGTAGVAPLPVDTWVQKSLMDGITYVRNIIGYIFYVDEDGGIVWRTPNYFALGNWVGNDASTDEPPRVTNIINIDEEENLIALTASVSGANVRERIFVAQTNGTTGALAAGYNPNPTGLRRVAGWTDQNFQSEEECQVMADLIALQQLFTYRTDKATINAYPAIQIDDQILITEQVTGEGYYHRVRGIDSNNDLEAGGWTYDLTTNWLGERPFDLWAFDPAGLSQETQTYLQAFNFQNVATMPDGSV